MNYRSCLRRVLFPGGKPSECHPGKQTRKATPVGEKGPYFLFQRTTYDLLLSIYCLTFGIFIYEELLSRRTGCLFLKCIPLASVPVKKESHLHEYERAGTKSSFVFYLN
jgi:hypothetical protein